MKKEINNLVIKQSMGNSKKWIPAKLLFAIVEIAECVEMWKKGKELWKDGKMKNATQEEWEKELAEELVDSIFYVIDTSRLLCPSANLDKVFLYKLEKNLSRNYKRSKEWKELKRDE